MHKIREGLYRYSLNVFFKDTATTEIYTLSLHDALPIYDVGDEPRTVFADSPALILEAALGQSALEPLVGLSPLAVLRDRKSTRLNSSHANISYAVFCLKKKICRPH